MQLYKGISIFYIHMEAISSIFIQELNNPFIKILYLVIIPAMLNWLL